MHVGWDNTGGQTLTEIRELLARHDNLYLNLKGAPSAHYPEHAPLDRNNDLKTEWADLIADYPDRIILGSDVFYNSDGAFTGGDPLQTIEILNQLPENIAEIVRGNTWNIYRLTPPGVTGN